MGRNNIFNRISNQSIFLAIVIIFILKIILYIGIKINLLEIKLGGGSDAEYYNSYALGYINEAVNAWPVLLRKLNDIGLYSRDLISYFFLFCNLILFPIIIGSLSGISINKEQKIYFYLLLLLLIYPTLYFFTFDIYRDVFMVLIFLLGCLSVKKMVNSESFIFLIFFLIINLAIGFLLIGLRPYLGYAFTLSLFLYKIKFTKKKIFIFGFVYIIVLFLGYSVGAFDSIIDYRSGFEEAGGGSTLGLDFTNPLLFIPNLILSTLGQLFGLYIINPLAAILFFIETIPFFGMLVYIIKNIKFADNFVQFLIIFFVLYASVWLLGNDNLGTALRLRFYNYIAVYICFFYILQVKRSLANKII